MESQLLMNFPTKKYLKTLTLIPLQLNSQFPILLSGIFACGRAVHFHCEIGLFKALFTGVKP